MNKITGNKYNFKLFNFRFNEFKRFKRYKKNKFIKFERFLNDRIKIFHYLEYETYIWKRCLNRFNRRRWKWKTKVE